MKFEWLRCALLTLALATVVACGGDDGDGDGGDAVCGDGVVDTGETCDDGNTDDGDGCSAACTSENEAGVCGDGTVDEGEACDDGNTDDGDGCNAECAAEACGNDVVDEGEGCDDGNTDEGDGCSADCVSEFCGDSMLDEGEVCDDGNTDDGDGCRADCLGEEICSDGLVDEGETCDDGNLDDGDGCSALCVAEVCGDGAINNVDEVCDDGNTDDDDGCRGDCAGVEVCGDMLLDVGEVCDDGNTDAGDGCRSDCLGEEICSDGIVDVAEQCDDGNMVDGDGCSMACMLEATPIAPVGMALDLTGTIDGTEMLWARPLSGCSSTSGVDHYYDVISIVNTTGAAQEITITSNWIGQGTLHIYSDPFDATDPTVNCIAGDYDFSPGGMSQLVRQPIAVGEVLHILVSTYDADDVMGDYAVDVFTESCGNNVIDGDDVCDDGNSVGGDGCSADCAKIEVCGDGVVDGGEECDDGNPDVGDGCDATCVLEPTAIAAPSSYISFAGTLDGTEALWARPGSTCSSTTDVDHYYDLIAITNATGTDQTVTITASWLDDGYLHVYDASFDAADTTSCIEGDDQFGTDGSQIADLPIAAGQVIYIVASTFTGGEAIGDYTINVVTVGAPVCGDTLVDSASGEQCDDGNDVDGDGCNATCQDEVCGDGVINNIDEVCDDGNADAGDGCAANCMGFEVCGDGNVDFGIGESCDDGNTTAGDGCDATCAAEPVSIAAPGMSVVITGTIDGTEAQWARPGSTCSSTTDADHYYDLIAVTNTTGADQIITITATWLDDGYLHVYSGPFDPADTTNCITGDDQFDGSLGSQIVDQPIAAGETLWIVASTFTGGEVIGDYSIDVETYLPPVCGDGIVEAPEQCDDSNAVDGDGCSAMCLLEPTEMESNDTSATANVYASPFIGGINPGGDVDYVSVTAVAGQTITAENIDLGDGTCSGFDTDSKITIFDVDGTTILDDDEDGSDGFCSLASATVAADGTYYVMLESSPQFAAGETFSYELVVTVQ